MLSFCWGQSYKPALILDETDDALIVELDGPKTIALSKIVGRVTEGDRIQVLVSGGAWLWGTAIVVDGRLWVLLDCGRKWVVSNANLISCSPMSDYQRSS